MIFWRKGYLSKMEIYNIIKNIKEKYYLDFNLDFYQKDILYYQIADSIIEETKFLNKLISRSKQGIPSYTVKASLPLVHWDLFQELINYYSCTFTDKLRDIIMLAVFLNRYFYVDNSWTIENVTKLKELIVDRELNGLLKYYLNRNCKQVLRESSFYYKDEVWIAVKDFFRADNKI